MKHLVAIISLFIVATALFVLSGFSDFSKEKYLDQKVLELSTPLDVKIDVVFLKSLKPADE